MINQVSWLASKKNIGDNPYGLIDGKYDQGRPYLWIGTSMFLDQLDELSNYFEEWLLPTNEESKKGK